ncbi:MAG: hypothetical protein II628_07570 [Lachnospiraceae bacterium]|nr:hypothetical protein [Lachnospiraceae bacterium]
MALGITEVSYDELQEMIFELMDARGEGRSLPEEERDVIYDLLYDHPIAPGDSIKTHAEELYCLLPLTRPSFIGRAGAGRSQISYQNGQYTSDFENREYIELIEQGGAEDAVIRDNQERSPVPIDGALLYVDSDLRVIDYDLDHGVYFTIPFMKDTYIPLYVLNGLGERLLRTYERMVWFTESGFSALFLAKEGSDQAYSDYIEWGISGQGDPGEVYQIDYDWDGNEIKRTLLGKMVDLEKFTRYEQHSDMAAASGSPIRAEKTDSGIRVTDSDGNSLGTISVEEPSQWSIQINGKMILINNQADYRNGA